MPSYEWSNTRADLPAHSFKLEESQGLTIAVPAQEKQGQSRDKLAGEGPRVGSIVQKPMMQRM